MRLPPSFEPYVLSPLDHSTGLIHISLFFTFEPEDVTQSVLLIQRSFTRCTELFPFLAGNVARSTQLKGKENVFEVQPSTIDMLQEYPFCKVKHHQSYVNPKNGSPAVKNDLLLQEDFVPIPFTMALEELSPAVRVQINVMPDGIIICFCLHHLVMDAAGLATVIEAFSICSRNPNASLSSMPTSPMAEQKSREIIFNTSSTFSGIENPDAGRGSVILNGATFTLESQSAISKLLSFNKSKIDSLKAACTEIILESKKPGSGFYLKSNEIVSAVIWLLFIRARHHISIKNNEPSPPESGIIVVSDVRSKIQPKLPLSYMGNAILPSSAYRSIESVVSRTNLQNIYTTKSNRSSSDDILSVADLAICIQNAYKSVTTDYTRAFISQFVNKHNWSPPIHIGDVAFSSIRSLGFYGFDFGPTLGPLICIDIPETRMPGLSWIMPIRVGNPSPPWEVRVTFEPETMKLVENDRLVRRLSCEEGPKL